jgi:predicted GNAT family N-acyltransferase
MVRVITSLDANQQAVHYDIRKQVLQIELGIKSNEDFDKYDADSKPQYFLALMDDKPVGSLRGRESQQFFKLDRLAVLSGERNKGVATALLNFALENISKNLPLHISSPEGLIPFFTKFGFTLRSGSHWVGGVIHKQLTLRR